MPAATAISSAMPFPPISWWMHLVGIKVLEIDTGEQYQKMSFRNKYRISGANNIIQLSVPLIKGRNQRTPVADVAIYNSEKWQIQHWRALTSAYRRTPYWEYFEPTLQPLYEQQYEQLVDFNVATIQWAIRQIKLDLAIVLNVAPVRDNESSELRNYNCKSTRDFPHYYQVFEDKIGFNPDLCIIDLMCAEGPATRDWLRRNCGFINPLST